MVANVCNILDFGILVGRKPAEGAPVKQVKYTVAYDGFAALLSKVFHEQTYISEDIAMPEVLKEIIEKDRERKNVYVFDRGMAAVYNFSNMNLKPKSVIRN